MNEDIKKMIDKVRNFININEGLDDSWADNETVVTLRQLLEITKDIPESKFEVSKLEPIALHKNNSEEEEAIERADLKYPILIFVNDDGSIKSIIDGHHRIQKAIKYKFPMINCKLIKFSDLPDDFKKVMG